MEGSLYVLVLTSEGLWVKLLLIEELEKKQIRGFAEICCAEVLEVLCRSSHEFFRRDFVQRLFLLVSSIEYRDLSCRSLKRPPSESSRRGLLKLNESCHMGLPCSSCPVAKPNDQ